MLDAATLAAMLVPPLTIGAAGAKMLPEAIKAAVTASKYARPLQSISGNIARQNYVTAPIKIYKGKEPKALSEQASKHLSNLERRFDLAAIDYKNAKNNFIDY